MGYRDRLLPAAEHPTILPVQLSSSVVADAPQEPRSEVGSSLDIGFDGKKIISFEVQVDENN